MRRFAALMMVGLLMILTLAGCEGSPAETATDTPESSVETAISATTETPLVGVALPSEDYWFWTKGAQIVSETLAEKGYTADIQYADQQTSTQCEQIDAMLDEGCKVLIIASLDGGALGDVLAKAKEADVTTIGCYRLLTMTRDVDYFVWFDNYGRTQGRYIEEALGLKSGKGPFNLEIFAADSGDGNMPVYYTGAMDILQPYIDNGQLVIRSGQIDRLEVATKNAEAENARARMESLLTEYYTEERVDAVLSPYDPISEGVVRALTNAGYGTEEKLYPVLTGMAYDVDNMGSVIEGSQSMTVFPDLRILLRKSAEMALAVLSGSEVMVNDVIENGVKQVPTFTCEPAVLTKDNIREYLIDGGYYTEASFPG